MLDDILAEARSLAAIALPEDKNAAEKAERCSALADVGKFRRITE